MHHSRTALVAFTAFALAACGAQSASTHSTVAALGAAPTTAATTSAATTSAAAATESATPAVAASTSPTSVRPTPTATRTRSAVVTPAATPVTTAGSKRPHFATPEAAMRYLAAAWNANDLTSLKHVTQGTARMLLLGMHHEAVNLRLDHCDLRAGGKGDYLCHFTHDYPASYPVKLRQGTHGTSEFIAAPSSSVGWYMFAYEGCG